jgi:hypothetical protein
LYLPVNFRIVGDPASSTITFKNDWIIAKGIWCTFRLLYRTFAPFLTQPSSTAVETGFAAACKSCRLGRLPVLENSDYCSRFCSNHGDTEVTHRQTVPTGFAPACQECCRAIEVNMEIYDGRFCSQHCRYAFYTSRIGIPEDLPTPQLV